VGSVPRFALLALRQVIVIISQGLDDVASLTGTLRVGS
jgi:hypothetical protein